MKNKIKAFLILIIILTIFGSISYFAAYNIMIFFYVLMILCLLIMVIIIYNVILNNIKE
jgi:hypothetical protein